MCAYISHKKKQSKTLYSHSSALMCGHKFTNKTDKKYKWNCKSSYPEICFSHSEATFLQRGEASNLFVAIHQNVEKWQTTFMYAVDAYFSCVALEAIVQFSQHVFHPYNVANVGLRSNHCMRGRVDVEFRFTICEFSSWTHFHPIIRCNCVIARKLSEILVRSCWQQLDM